MTTATMTPIAMASPYARSSSGPTEMELPGGLGMDAVSQLTGTPPSGDDKGAFHAFVPMPFDGAVVGVPAGFVGGEPAFGRLVGVGCNVSVELVDLTCFGRPVTLRWREHRFRCPRTWVSAAVVDTRGPAELVASWHASNDAVIAYGAAFLAVLQAAP